MGFGKKQKVKQTDMDVFDNPVAETGVSPTAPTTFESESPKTKQAMQQLTRKSTRDEVDSDLRSSILSNNLETQTEQPGYNPRTHEYFDTDSDDAEFVDPPEEEPELIEIELQERHATGRSTCVYLLFQSITVLLLPGYIAIFFLAAWACYEVTNPVSIVGTIVSFIIPWLLFYGFQCARHQKMEALRCYAFLLLLAVCLQISLCMVILLDSCDEMVGGCVYGSMTDEYLMNIADTARTVCQNAVAFEIKTGGNGGVLPYREICACLSGASGGSAAGSWWEDGKLLQQKLLASLNRDEQMSLVADIECLGDAMTAATISPTEVRIILLATLLVELALSSLAYHMMVDLDAKAARKAAKQKGGPRIGTLRGKIISGRTLRAGHAQIPKSKRANNFSSRYVELSVTNRNVVDKAHRQQTFKTNEIEDDPDPVWDAEFDDIALYRDSKKMEIKVYDVIQRGKKLEHVLVGRAGTYTKTRSPNGVRMDFETPDDATLVDLDYVMNGTGSVWVQLFHLQDRKTKHAKRHKSGQVEIQVQFAPTRAFIKQNAALITDTWYFEASVLAMVALAMISLAIQSPASPPSTTLYAVIRIIDIFVATELTLEALMEIEVNLSHGIKGWYRKRGFLFNMFVLFCNWSQIIAPSALLQATQTARETPRGAGVIAGKLFSVGRVLRIVRPIRTFRLIENVDIIVRVLSDSVPLFLTVQLLLVFLLAIFALVGVSSFSGALQFECIESDTCSHANQAAADRLGLECPLPCPNSLKCHVDDGFQFCAPLATPRVVGYDPFGFRNMDNFWNGMMSTFVQTTGDGGLHTMPLALYNADALGVSRSWFLSFAVSMVLHLVSLNLFLAVCCSAYSDVAERAHIVAAEVTRLKKAVILEEIQNETEQQREQRLAAIKAEEETNKPNHQRLREKHWDHKSSKCPELRNKLLHAMQTETFGSATTFVIVGNTITMAMVHKDMDPELENTLVVFELIFLVCYVLEASWKLLGSGSHLYFRSLENKFDLFVILSSTFGVIATFFKDEMQSVVGQTVNLGSVQSFRAVRLLRALQIVRLLHRQKALIMVMKTIFQAWRPLLLHSIFCCFSMSVFSIIGMHVFGGSLRPEECLAEACTIADYDRVLPEHFENFQTGFLTVFEMTVGEEWSHSMYWYMEHAGHRGMGYPTWVVELYFVFMYIWMNGILFSLYVAMLLENFSIPEGDKYPLQKVMFERQRRKARQQMRSIKQSLLTSTVNAAKRKGYVERGDGKVIHQLRHAGSGVDVEDSSTRSLYIFGLKSEFRLRCAQVQESKMFRKIIMTLIAFSCVSLAAEGRGELSTGWVQDNMVYLFGYSLFDWLNLAVLVAFVIEGSLKAVIHGFILKSGPTKPYLKSRMNQVDFCIIVLCSASYIPFVPIAGPWARALRMGRVITPMMNLTKSPQIALVVLSFVRAAPDTAVVLLPLILMGVVFSIVGVASFSGRLAYCAPLRDPLEKTPTLLIDGESISLTQDVCLNQTNYNWVTPQLGFDSSVKGLATLLVAMTDGSHPFMLKFYKTAGRVSFGFWVGFHLVFTCFFLNLFLGVLTASFEKSSGSALMTIGEKQWLASIRMLGNFTTSGAFQVEDVKPTQKSRTCGRRIPPWWLVVRRVCYSLANNERLETLFRYTIAANTCTLASDMYPINPVHADIVGNLNLLFLSICTFEVVVKMIGYGPRFFFHDGWLVSDFILVSSSLFLLLSGGQSGVESLRVMRVFRIIVLGSRIPALVALVDIVVACMKASFAVVLLTALAVYLYSIIGMNLFGALPTDDVFERFEIPQSNPDCDIEEQPLCRWADVRKRDDLMSIVCPSCEAFSDYTNFNDFTHSFRLLVQVAFGQGIGGFVSDLESLGAKFWPTFAYFASFYMITVWVSMNLLIVTVLSNFDAANTSTHSHNTITPLDLEGFAHTWAALTIGVHRNAQVTRSSSDLLDNLQSKLRQENEDADAVVSPVHEDGCYGGSGKLAVRIERLEGIKSKDSRLYCAITLQGTDAKGEETRLTRTVKNTDGTAIYKPMLDARRKMRAALGLALPVADSDDEDAFDDSIGETVLFHVTSYHTRCCIQVHDAFQFTDTLMGAVCLPMEEILGHDGGRSFPLAIKEMKHGSSNCSHVLELWVKEDGQVAARSSGGENDRWYRHEQTTDDVESESDGGDSDVEPDVVSAEADPDDAIDDPPEVVQSASNSDKRERKRQAKAHKKTEKAARKAAKKAQKAKERAASGERSWIQRLQFWKKQERRPVPNEDEGDEDIQTETPLDPWEALNPYAESKGWRKTSIKLSITFEYQEEVHTVPTTGWLKDHGVRFTHMQHTCGVAGWMELSEAFKPFKRRYCYIQDEPTPAFGFYRNAKNIDELERMSTVKLDVHKIEGSSIMMLCEGHDNKIHQRRNQRRRNFTIECEEEVENGGKEERCIGVLSGIIRSASDLINVEEQCGASKAKQLCKIVHFPADDDDDAEDALVEEPTEESADGNADDSQSDIYAFVNYPDQEQIVPKRYVACHRTGYHLGCEPDAEQVGVLHKNTIVMITQTRVANGVRYLRCEKGWLRGNCDRRNNSFLIPENSQNPHYMVLKNCDISANIAVSSAKVGSVRKHSVVEVFESQLDDNTGSTRFKIRSCGGLDLEFGWISELDLDEEATPDPYCIMQIKPNLPAGIENLAAPRPEESESKRDPKRRKKKRPLGPSTEPEPGLPPNSSSISIISDKVLKQTAKRLTNRAVQKANTKVVDNDLTPLWGTKFKFDIFASCTKAQLTVLDEGPETVLGFAEIEIGSGGVPGPSVSTTAQRDVQLVHDRLTTVNVPLVDAEGNSMGTVCVGLAYEELVMREELLEQQLQATRQGGNLVAAMLKSQTKLAVYRFQCPTLDHQRQWLSVLRWIAGGAAIESTPRKLYLPPVMLAPSAAKRAENDISLVDLPFDRVASLLHGLYRRRVMGSHKPTLRRVAFTVFQLETHAWRSDAASIAKKDKRVVGYSDADGQYLVMLRGLNFHKCLERLIMLHYGKRQCLSYRQQVEEFEMEMQHIALQILQTFVSRWVFKTRARLRQTVGGVEWPWHSSWRKHRDLYFVACEAVCAQRILTLKQIKGEVQRMSKPIELQEDLVETSLADRNGTGQMEQRTPEGRNQKKSSLPCFKTKQSIDRQMSVDAVATLAEGVDDIIGSPEEHVELDTDRRERIAKAFKQIDTNGNGELEEDELRQVMTLLSGTEPSPREIKLVMHELDEEGSGTVSLEEFMNAIEGFDSADTHTSSGVGDGDDDLDEFGTEFDASPHEQLMMALAD